MSQDDKKHVMSIAICDGLHDRIKREARWRQLSRSELVRKSLMIYFDLLDRNGKAAPMPMPDPSDL